MMSYNSIETSDSSKIAYFVKALIPNYIFPNFLHIGLPSHSSQVQMGLGRHIGSYALFGGRPSRGHMKKALKGFSHRMKCVD